MLHSAALRSRQPAITAAAADQLVRLSLTGVESTTQRNGTEGEVTCVTPKAAAAAATAAAVLQKSNPRLKVKMPVLHDVEQGVILEEGERGRMVVVAPAPAPASPSVSAETPRTADGASSSGGTAGEGVVITSPRVVSPFSAAAERAPSDG
jgi:hypothetical protein